MEDKKANTAQANTSKSTPGRMSIYPPQYLTSEEVEHFLHNGYIHLKGCFTRETAKRWTDDLWIRLGYSPTDPSTWLTDRINMPSHRSESIKNLAPTAWLAICDLLGGEDRVTPESSNWNDALIVNLGSASKNCSYDDEWNEPKDLRGWHVDGDSFFHFLNSPEQALLVIPLFSDIKPHGGGTIICPQGIPVIAKHLVSLFTPALRGTNKLTRSFILRSMSIQKACLRT
jgi:hypothetical protein